MTGYLGFLADSHRNQSIRYCGARARIFALVGSKFRVPAPLIHAGHDALRACLPGGRGPGLHFTTTTTMTGTGQLGTSSKADDGGGLADAVLPPPRRGTLRALTLLDLPGGLVSGPQSILVGRDICIENVDQDSKSTPPPPETPFPRFAIVPTKAFRASLTPGLTETIWITARQ